jgi:hypothetical protein
MPKFSSKFDLIINLSLIVIGFFAIATVYKGCQENPEKSFTRNGTKIELSNIDLSQKDKHVVIVLDVEDSEVALNVSFYKFLAQSQENSNSFKVTVLFTNDSNRVDSFLKTQNWATENQSAIDFSKYNLQIIPTMLIVGNNGLIEKMYDGVISSYNENEIKKTLQIQTVEAEKIIPLKKLEIREIYREDAPNKEIMLPAYIAENHEGAKYQQLSYKQINDFGVDSAENIYVIYQEYILKVDKSGNIISKVKLNSETSNGFTVDYLGNSYLFLRSKKILILNNFLENKQLLDLEDKLLPEEMCVRMSFGNDKKRLFFQTYNTTSTKQSLYSIDIDSQIIEEIYSIEKTPYTFPTIGPGLFDWAIDNDKLFVSDISKYQIEAFSLKDKKRIGLISEDFREIPINPTDSYLKSIDLDLPHILKPEGMLNYPAIWSIRVTQNGKLIVFSSERDEKSRHTINIYDDNLNKLGTDYKYFRPTKNNFVFSHNLIYSADCSPKSDNSFSEISPIDTVKTPISIKVFKSLIEK